MKDEKGTLSPEEEELVDYIKSSVTVLDQIIKFYYSPMLQECKNDATFPLTESEIHQTFTNLGFVLNFFKKFSNAFDACERDPSTFLSTLQLYLTLPQFGAESEFGIICTEYAKNYGKVVVLLNRSEHKLKEFITNQFEKYPSNTIQSGLIWPIKAPVHVGMLLNRLIENSHDVIIRDKLQAIKESVQDVAFEVNKTFPLELTVEFYLKTAGVICLALGVVGTIYLYVNRKNNTPEG
jgi:hypothetical protein